MIKFVVYEDDKDFLEIVCFEVNRALISYNMDYKICRFSKYCRELEDIIKNDNEEKIYILDVMLRDKSGLELASDIREVDCESIIMFLTAHKEYREDIFYSRLLAIDYISKNGAWGERLRETVKKSVKTLNYNKVLVYEFCGNTYRIPYREILYIEKVSSYKKCLIYTNSEDGAFEIASTLIGVLDLLGPGFYQTHKSFITNIDSSRRINYKTGFVTFDNGESVYLVSEKRRKDFKNYVSNY